MPLPLEILADLQLSVNGEPIDVRGDGDRVVIDLPTLRAGRTVINSGPFAGPNRRKRVEQLHEALSLAGITAEVRLRGDTIARIGAGASPSRLMKALNVGPVEVRPGTSVLSVVKERPLLAVAAAAGLAGLIAWIVSRSRND